MRSTDKGLIPCRWVRQLFLAKLRQQRSPPVDILVTRAAEVLDQREASQDFLLGSLDRLGKALVKLLLGHGRALRVAAGRRRWVRQGLASSAGKT